MQVMKSQFWKKIPTFEWPAAFFLVQIRLYKVTIYIYIYLTFSCRYMCLVEANMTVSKITSWTSGFLHTQLSSTRRYECRLAWEEKLARRSLLLLHVLGRMREEYKPQRLCVLQALSNSFWMFDIALNILMLKI